MAGDTSWLLNRRGSPDDGAAVVFGNIVTEHMELAKTAELPWLDNRKGVSCVRADMYKVLPHPTEPDEKLRLENTEFGDSLQGRTEINVEVMNHPAGRNDGDKHESEGCIAAGLDYTKDGRGVLHSRKAVARVIAAARDAWQYGDLYLVIQWEGS